VIRAGLLLLLALPLAAQQGRVDVFGLIGVGATYDDEGSLGRGVSGAAGIGYRLTKRLGIEGEVNAFSSKRDFGQIVPPFQHSGAHVMGNALLHFGPSRAQFYLLGGVGLLHVKNKSTNQSDNGFNVGLGLGMKIFATSHIYIRPDFRIFGGSTNQAVESPFSMLRLGVGVGYSW
jgi:opacity protein-like surface antigen